MNFNCHLLAFSRYKDWLRESPIHVKFKNSWETNKNARLPPGKSKFEIRLWPLDAHLNCVIHV